MIFFTKLWLIKISIALKSTNTHIKNNSVVLLVIGKYRALQVLRALIVGYNSSFFFLFEIYNKSCKAFIKK